MILHLPYPPSTNRLWRISGNRLYASAEAVAYKRTARELGVAMGATPQTGPMIVSIRLHPRVTKTGEASQVRVDIDNAIKCALDAGNLLLWADDKQVVKLYAEVADPIPYGGLTLEAHPLAA